MRRAFLFAALLAVGSAAFADWYVSMGWSAGTATEHYSYNDARSKLDVTTPYGINLTAWVASGKKLGMYAVVDFLVPTRALSDGAELNLDDYTDPMILDMIWGVGKELKISPRLNAIVGGGLFLGITSVENYSDIARSYLAILAPGLGAAGTLFFEIYRFPETSRAQDTGTPGLKMDAVAFSLGANAHFSVFSPIAESDEPIFLFGWGFKINAGITIPLRVPAPYEL